MTARYRPGGVSRLLAWVDALPLHGWWVFPGLAALLLAWSHGIIWGTGRLPFGTFDPLLTAGVVYAPYTLTALAYVNGVAERSLVSFWPATGWPDSEREAWRYQFVTSPAGYGLSVLLVGVLVAIGAFLSAPPSVVHTGSDWPIFLAAYAPSAVLGYSLVVVAVIHTSRQLRLVARIHREATAIDPFDRVPVYAFSELTTRTGLAFVVGGYYSLTVNGAFQAGNLVGLGTLAATFAIGTACFVLPLLGIHDRLVQAKELLLRDVELRLSRVGGELYRRIDAGEFEATKVISESLAGVTALRERVVHLPTWPWSPQLLRGFLSALLLPVIVYMITRLISDKIGP